MLQRLDLPIPRPRPRPPASIAYRQRIRRFGVAQVAQRRDPALDTGNLASVGYNLTRCGTSASGEPPGGDCHDCTGSPQGEASRPLTATERLRPICRHQGRPRAARSAAETRPVQGARNGRAVGQVRTALPEVRPLEPKVEDLPAARGSALAELGASAFFSCGYTLTSHSGPFTALFIHSTVPHLVFVPQPLNINLFHTFVGLGSSMSMWR